MFISQTSQINQSQKTKTKTKYWSKLYFKYWKHWVSEFTMIKELTSLSQMQMPRKRFGSLDISQKTVNLPPACPSIRDNIKAKLEGKLWKGIFVIYPAISFPYLPSSSKGKTELEERKTHKYLSNINYINIYTAQLLDIINLDIHIYNSQYIYIE